MILLPTWSSAAPSKVCATTPDIGHLTEIVGGDLVDVTVLVKGREDPHYLEARPAFVKAVNRADLFIQNGLGLEVGWAPVLIETGANTRILPGKLGYLDLGETVTPLFDDVPSHDRSAGHVHPEGNPHYFLDPFWAAHAATQIQARLAALHPNAKGALSGRLEAFLQRLGAAVVGEALAAKYDWTKLSVLYAHGKLDMFLKQVGEDQPIGGWIAALRPFAEAKVAVDHQNYLYFATRFRLRPVLALEPKPGIKPTTRHLTKVVKQMREQNINVVLTSAYIPPRYAEFVRQHTSAQLAVMAHQVGARPGIDSYIKLVENNVQAVTNAFAAAETTASQR